MSQKHSQHCPYCKLDSKTRTLTFLPQLEDLTQGGRKSHRKKLKNADGCLIRYLGDAAGAVLRTDIKLPSEAYPKISPYRNLLLFLAKKKNSVTRKRERLLKQKGGAIPLLGLLTTALTSALGGFGGKALADYML